MDISEFKPVIPDSIVVIKVPREHLARFRLDGIGDIFGGRMIFVIPDDMSIEELSTERMAELGWVKEVRHAI